MSQPINTTPITQYGQMVRAAELSQQKEIRIPIHTARLLNVALIELLDKVTQDYDALYQLLSNTDDKITVALDGGSF